MKMIGTGDLTSGLLALAWDILNYKYSTGEEMVPCWYLNSMPDTSKILIATSCKNAHIAEMEEVSLDRIVAV